MGHHVTLGYLKSKLIKSPLKFNTEWNEAVNDCVSATELYDLCQSEGTDNDVQALMFAIDITEEMNGGL